MGLIHYSPRYTDRELKTLRNESREHFPGTFLCRDRMVIALPHQDEVDRLTSAARRFLLFSLAILAVTLLFGGCRRSRTDLPAELSSALSSLSGPLRLTWYLSSELTGEDSLKAVDGILTSLAAAAESGGIDVTAVVRPPFPGERKPADLLPLPAADARGRLRRSLVGPGTGLAGKPDRHSRYA